MSDPRKKAYEAALQFAEKQVLSLAERHPDYFPIYTVKGKWRHEGELWTDWTGGFLAGMMWQFFKRTGNADWGHLAERANEDSLTPDERTEYQDYVDAADLIGFFKLKARRLLQGGNSS